MDSIYTDFSKAFDRVNFHILLAKLSAMGFSAALGDWLGSFLRGRMQSIIINNYVLNTFEVSSGVPQGSHCAPLLFNLFVNDIFNELAHSKVRMLADDLKMYRRIECQRDAELL